MPVIVSALAPRPRWPSRGLRLCVLFVILAGTLMSSLGALHAHALAPLDAVTLHDPAPDDDAHGHSHDDEPLATGEGAPHTHLGADHSHDKAHALPTMPALGMAAAPPWKARSLARIDRLMPHRLERPPKTA